jgi:SAM-dependent methyltransferase
MNPETSVVEVVADEIWESDCKKIYDNYDIYFQGGGAEQSVFDQVTGTLVRRSDIIVRSLKTEFEGKDNGIWLDIGCGNGAFLGALSRAFPSWQSMGTEWSDAHRQEIDAIPGSLGLHVGDASEIKRSFDGISLIHVLEHIPNPSDYLRRIKTRLAPNGILLIQVPNYAENPFELLIADHFSHFSPETLRKTVENAGFNVLAVKTDVVCKEITLFAGSMSYPTTPFSGACYDEKVEIARVKKCLEWLTEVRQQTMNIAEGSKRFGLFGTSIAGTWLAEEIGRKFDFFLDEDSSRIEKSYMGKPIYAPTHTPKGADVYVGLSPGLSHRICKIWKHLPARFYEVPPLV